MQTDSKYLKLNKSEFLYLVVEDLAPSVSQMITLRLATVHSEEEIRSAFRHIMDLYPKLRTIVEPTLFSQRLKVISDEIHINALFDDAFKIKKDLPFDSQAFKDYQNEFLNESFTLQQALPIKIRFLPEENILLISVHHMTCDGVGWINMVSSLMAHLNGKETVAQALEDPSMVPGVFQKPYITAPIQVFKSWKLLSAENKKTAQDKIISPAETKTDFIGSVSMKHRYLQNELADLKPKAKSMGYSLNIYFLTALARSFFERYGEEHGDTVSIRLSYDLRPYFDKDAPVFGNYVTTSILRAYRKDMASPQRMMENLQSQLTNAIDRLKHKKLSYPWLLDKAFTLIGKKLYSLGILAGKRKDTIPVPTIHFSTVGSLDFLNKAGEKAQVKDVIATVPTFGMFMTLCNIDGVFNVNLSYPSAEFSDDKMESFIGEFDQELGSLASMESETATEPTEREATTA